MKLSGPSLIGFISTCAMFPAIVCQQPEQQQQATPNSSQQIFNLIIIIGGYVALLIGAIIFRLQARESKVIQFEQVGARGSSTTEHKFQQLQQEIDQSSAKKPSLEYQTAAGDSTKRRRRKRKADRLSDRRKNDESNQSNEQNDQADD